MEKLEKKYYSNIIEFIKEKPENTIPLFFLKNEDCVVYAENGNFEKGFILVPDCDLKDLYLFGEIDPGKLRSFLKSQKNLRTLSCPPSSSVTAVKSDFFRRSVKNLIYSYREKPEMKRDLLYPLPQKLSHKNKGDLLIVPPEAGFIYRCFSDLDNFLNRGAVYAVFTGKQIASLAATSAISEKYADISVYTRIAHRRKGYSYSCSLCLIKELFSINKIPAWTTDQSHTESKNLAEKLGMTLTDEIYCFY